MISTMTRKIGSMFFNNMGVLSRAFWVQDDSEGVCDEHAIFRNGHRTVSAKQIWIVVFKSVGVSPGGA